MQVFIGADYRGLELKDQLKNSLADKGYEIVDKGAYEYVEGDDFNDSAVSVAKSVLENPNSYGILVCDSAHGMTMQANRFKGIRAAHCGSRESAKLAREHDDANILCLSAHFMNASDAASIAETFLATDFQNLERRVRRINRLDEREDYD